MPDHRITGLGVIALAVVVAGCTSPSSPSNASGAQPPAGTGLAAVIGADAAALYTSHPLTGGQETPAHVFLQQSDGRFLFYHLNNDDVAKATGLMFVGDAFPGKFCVGDGGVSKAQYDAGYVHFHLQSAPNWDAGHNNGGIYDPNAQGFWFRHIGATDGAMQMMGQTMMVHKGQPFPLMPADFAKVQACAGAMAHDTLTLGQQVARIYTDHPLGGGQDTPAHVFFNEPDGNFLFLHLNKDDVSTATGLMFAGDAFPGKMCKGAGGVTQEQYDAGYVHFHLQSAPNWDAGHNNGGIYASGPQAQGFWFRHIGATDGSMAMMGDTMMVHKGQVFPLMPANWDQLLPC